MPLKRYLKKRQFFYFLGDEDTQLGKNLLYLKTVGENL